MVMDIISERMSTKEAEYVESNLAADNLPPVMADITPGETFYLAAEFRRRYPDQNDYWREAGRDLADLSRRSPDEVSWQRLAEDFGVPHPAMQDDYSRDLLDVKPFPAFMGYASRLLAESWDSNNLYWARLADEKGYSPVMLNLLVPQLTRRMVEKIFASHFEDWPALLNAMRETGDEFRQGKVAYLTPAGVEVVRQ
jgi:hypothetical protein